MASFHLRLSSAQRAELDRELVRARQIGDLPRVNRVLSILAFAEGMAVSEIARLLKVSREAVRGWLKRYLLDGVKGTRAKKSPGRPAKLTKSQRRELCKLIDEGPAKAGLSGNCWRSPMIQRLIQERFGVFHSVRYISELLKSMGFSYQKARFVSDHLNPEKREQWLNNKWPQILELARRKNAYLLFGDEASFPQWGTLSYTWARKGRQPTIETSGKRKGYKVFGLIDYFTGRCFFKCQEERLNSQAYAAYLKEVLGKTRKHIVLIQDGARYHTSAAMKAFFEAHKHRLTVFDLPSYSPDYNPIEKLWKKVKEKGTHLHYFHTFEALKDKVHETLSFFENAKDEVLSLVRMYQALA
jgi:transposase